MIFAAKPLGLAAQPCNASGGTALSTCMTAHERRAWNRYSCDLKTLCHPAEQTKAESRPARICDISCGGVKLASSHPFPLGTALTLRLDGADHLAPRSLSA